MKELLVSSRRKRNYFVRFAYPVVLAVFVALIWATVYNYKSSIYQVSQMAQVGIHITVVVVWFQFIVVQILAVIMLSTAISDEIYHKTLGVLMTTPIGSFQIVFSKLLSKLFQLLLIVAISLPVLAIIRVFGGVPWNYVLSSLCITLTAVIFAGSLSLLFSIYSRQSHFVIGRMFSVLFILYAVPLIANIVLQGFFPRYNNPYWLISRHVLFFINPFIQMQTITNNMLSPSGITGTGVWIWHCAVMLGLSAIVLVLSGFCVRKAGLRQVTGQAGLFLTGRERKIADKKRQLNYSTAPAQGKIRDIKWPPVIWREIANPLIKSRRITVILSFILSAAVLVVVYGLCFYFDVLGDRETQIGFVLTYFFIGLLRTTTFASTSITSEKEARTWPILLASPLAEKEIAFGKIIGSCLRAWLYWLLFAAHVAVFILAGIIKAAVLIPLVLLVASSALLVSAVGVMFSSLCKRNSTSTSLNVVAFLLFMIPACCTPLSLGSPFFAVLSIFGVFSGFGGMASPFSNSPSSPFYLIVMLLISRYSFIIFVFVYLLATYAAYAISTSHIRWRIL